jgi:threonine synthase
MPSYLKTLICSECGEHYDPDQVQTFCPTCQATLLAQYDLNAMRSSVDRDAFRHRPRGMWRWQEILPVRDPDNFVHLGEGDTPLLKTPHLEKALSIEDLYVKDESINPTGTFKARGLAAAVSKAKELGVQKVIIPTAGNAGGALAAYAARAGLRAHIFMPADTPQANVAESQIAGAAVEMVDGLISDAGALARAKAAAEGWFDVSTFKEPYRTEGKKIMGYELAETLGWSLPDAIIYPTGGGTGLVGMWKAFQEMRELGWLENTSMPRMISVQAEGCAPVVKAWQEGDPACEAWPDAHTVASGLRVPKSFADRLILRDIRASGGAAVAVSDDELLAAQRQMAEAEGIFPAPEGAATLAALDRLLADGTLPRTARVVLFNTGTGLKYLS